MKTLRIAFSTPLLLCLIAATPVSAQVFFRMDFDAGSAPNAGWTATSTSATHNRIHIPAGGPDGDDAYELVQRVTGASSPFFGGEFYWGWTGMIEPQNPAQGARRYYRFRMRFSPNTNFRGLDTGGSPTTLINKVLLVGDGCGRSDCRVILNYRGLDNFRQAYLQLQIDGGASPATTPAVNIGEWLTVQVELISSSSSSSANGGYKIWVNNNNYGSPTAQRTGIVLNPVNWRYVMLGSYVNNGLASNGVHTIRYSGFEAATTFDAGYFRGPSSPATPTNLRIIPGGE